MSFCFLSLGINVISIFRGKFQFIRFAQFCELFFFKEQNKFFFFRQNVNVSCFPRLAQVKALFIFATSHHFLVSSCSYSFESHNYIFFFSIDMRWHKKKQTNRKIANKKSLQIRTHKHTTIIYIVEQKTKQKIKIVYCNKKRKKQQKWKIPTTTTTTTKNDECIILINHNQWYKLKSQNIDWKLCCCYWKTKNWRRRRFQKAKKNFHPFRLSLHTHIYNSN